MKKLTFGIVASLMLSTMIYLVPVSSKGGTGRFELTICTVHDSNGNIVQIGNDCDPGRTTCVPNKCGGGPQT